MAKFTWQDGTLVSKAKVEIGGTIYEVDPEEYSGATPLSASNLNAMQDGIYEDIDQNAEDISNLIKITEKGFIPSSSMTNATIGGTDGKKYNLLFTKTYTNPPTVLATYNHSGELSSVGFIQVAVGSITTTGCRFLFSARPNSSEFGINYIVISND